MTIDRYQGTNRLIPIISKTVDNQLIPIIGWLLEHLLFYASLTVCACTKCSSTGCLCGMPCHVDVAVWHTDAPCVLKTSVCAVIVLITTTSCFVTVPW